VPDCSVFKNFLPKTIPEPDKANQIGQVLAEEREEYRDEGHKGAE
jgi:glyceraldehyde-3-phosphate dehydrogenase (NAD(P))